eukprot:COSAG01_NODE_204_length_22090_cov_64.189441_19_plen_104_part_00
MIEIPASQQTNSAQLHVQLESSNPTSSSHTVHLEAVRGSVQLAVAPYELVLLYGRLYGCTVDYQYSCTSTRPYDLATAARVIRIIDSDRDNQSLTGIGYCRIL